MAAKVPKANGRPKKQAPADKIKDALNVAQDTIDSLMPADVQETLAPTEKTDVVVEKSIAISKDAKDDYEFARANIHALLLKGNDVLDGITELAREGDAPRTYEVAGQLLKTLIDGTRELMGLQKDIRDVEKKTVGTGADENSSVNVKHADNVNHNTVIDASTMEMLDVLAELKTKARDKKEASE